MQNANKNKFWKDVKIVTYGVVAFALVVFLVGLGAKHTAIRAKNIITKEDVKSQNLQQTGVYTNLGKTR